MSEARKDFVAYEYRDITVNRNMEHIYADSYQNFGWELVDKPMTLTNVASTAMRFKRDRKILNKAELTRLQREFDACVGEITALENSKHSGATIASIIVGLIGTAFLAGSVFAVTADPPLIVLCIVLGVPGLIGWMLPYFTYKRVQFKQTMKMEPLIDMKYDEIYEVCEKASGLLPK